MPRFLHKLFLVVCPILYLASTAHASGTLPIKRIVPSCANLARTALPQAAILSATLVPAGKLSISGVTVATFASLPAFCRVVVESTPSSDSDIMIEVWMPSSGWNGRFLGTGNGGFAGALNYSQMANALLYGYATAGTDTGHVSSAETDASWALGHPEKVIDYGYRAIHEMTLAAQALILDYFERQPAHNYFASCSDGGREALVEAERYPTDYNGILAGDPANNWSNLIANGAVDLIALTAQSASYLSAAKLPAITAAVLASCNKGVETGYLNNPSACAFNPQTLLCKGAETNSCLTQPQIVALKQIYSGSATSTGAQVFPGLTPGSENGSGGDQGWAGWVTGSARGNSGMAHYVEGYYADMVYENADWNYLTFNLTQALAASQATGAIINATNPNLNAFHAAGGKLILYHGWNDPAISPYSTIDYYNSVVSAIGKQPASETLQLYMVPGMGHCQGGAGPTNFSVNPGPTEPNSLYQALQLWVEDSVTPQQVETTGTTVYNGQTIGLSRPLCPYPQIATYTGSGSPYEAANFTCAAP
jgi:feruloyl esterase